MKKEITKMFGNVIGGVDLIGVLIDVILLSALVPVIVTFIKATEGNLTSTEFTLLSLTTLFLVIALVYSIIKQSGLTNK